VAIGAAEVFDSASGTAGVTVGVGLHEVNRKQTNTIPAWIFIDIKYMTLYWVKRYPCPDQFTTNSTGSIKIGKTRIGEAILQGRMEYIERIIHGLRTCRYLTMRRHPHRRFLTFLLYPFCTS
jgi:hypothetical protein